MAMIGQIQSCVVSRERVRDIVRGMLRERQVIWTPGWLPPMERRKDRSKERGFIENAARK